MNKIVTRSFLESKQVWARARKARACSQLELHTGNKTGLTFPTGTEPIVTARQGLTFGLTARRINASISPVGLNGIKRGFKSSRWLSGKTLGAWACCPIAVWNSWMPENVKLVFNFFLSHLHQKEADSCLLVTSVRQDTLWRLSYGSSIWIFYN